MRIVQIEDHVHANAGYLINVLSKYLVKEGHEVFIVTAEIEKLPDTLKKFFGNSGIKEADSLYEKKNNVKIIRIPVIGYISGRVLFSPKIFSVVNNLNPDIAYIYGNDTIIGMQYTILANQLKFPIILDSHMLEMASVNPFRRLFRIFYKLFITPIIIKNKTYVIRTQNDNYVYKCLGIPLKQCPWISFGSDTLLFKPNKEIKHSLRQKYNIAENALVFISTGKLVKSKGADLLAKAFEQPFVSQKEIILIVIGNSNGEFGQQLENIFSNCKNRILRFPTQKYEDLAKYYQMSDISIFAKQCSLSFFDAQACGLPVILEDNNVNLERCSCKNGMCFKSNSLDDLRSKVQEFINMSEKELNIYSQNSINYIKSNYDYKEKAKEYLHIMKSVINNFKYSSKE